MPTTSDFEIVSVDGKGTELLLGVHLSADTSRSAEVMRSGQPDVIEDLSTASNVPGGVGGISTWGPVFTFPSLQTSGASGPFRPGSYARARLSL